MPPHAAAMAFERAGAYVLPAVNEVFPMSILEAFVGGAPVVTTDSLGIAEACRRFGAALVTNGDPARLADAVERVISDSRLSASLRDGALRYVRDELSIERVAETLSTEYARAIEATAHA